MNYLVEELIQHLDNDDLMARTMTRVKNVTELKSSFDHSIDLHKRKAIELIKQYPIVTLSYIPPMNDNNNDSTYYLTAFIGDEVFYSWLYVNYHFNELTGQSYYWAFNDHHNRRLVISHDGKFWSVDELLDRWTRCDIDIRIRSVHNVEDRDTCRFFDRLKTIK
jgi:hypothetical protein